MCEICLVQAEYTTSGISGLGGLSGLGGRSGQDILV